MKNSLVARTFERIADILEIKGAEFYKVRAYRLAAQTIAGLVDNIEEIAKDRRLMEIPGIGKGLAGKIEEIIATGSCKECRELEKEFPISLVEMLAIPDVGPKKVRFLYDNLGIKSVDDLEEAAKNQRLRGLPGMGAKTEEKILAGIEQYRRNRERIPLGIALPHAEEFLNGLKGLTEVEQISLAGSIRRMSETVKDIDICAASKNPAKVIDAFVALPESERVLNKGETEASVISDRGIRVDLRIVPPEKYGALLQHFTGSALHNTFLRGVAVDRGIKLNEYGVFNRETDEVILSPSDECQIYELLRLPCFPPEIREGHGEIEAAYAGKFPKLIEDFDIRGDLHAHTIASDGGATMEEMAKAAQMLGYEYLGITDHSKSLTVAHGQNEDQLLHQIKAIRKFNESSPGIKVIAGIEVDILPDGALDMSDEILAELDLVIASVHSKFGMDEDEMTKRVVKAAESEHVDIIGHPTGRLLGQRDPYKLDIRKVMEAAAANHTALEINSYPDRLDLNADLARQAKSLGCKIAINTDSHNPSMLGYIRFGLATARKGWLEAEDVINTWTYDRLIDWLKTRRERS